MIPVTKLRNGVNFKEGNQLYRVVEYKHTHLSRGSGTVKVRCMELKTGRLVTKTYKGNDRVEEIEVFRKPMQYLYQEGDNRIFMDAKTFEQVEIASDLIGDQQAYLVEGEVVGVVFWQDEPLTVELPPKMEFVVAEAAPGEKGDSASNMYKDAKLENGVKIRVPLFVNAGEKIRVDTRDGSYIERVKE